MTDKTREAWETELLTHEPSGKPQVWFTRKEVVPIISAATDRAMAEAVKACEADRLDDTTGTEGDAAYNRAIGHCITAIKEALK